MKVHTSRVQLLPSSRCNASRSLRRSIAGVRQKLIRHPVHDSLVEIFAAQEGIAGSRKHLKDAVVHLQDRDIERAAAKIVNRNSLNFRLARDRKPARPPWAR